MVSKPGILVVGSVNMDLVLRAARMPAPGETVLGHDLITSPGGKGANQAVAAARLGADCRMLGRIGDDAFGEELLDGLETEGVDCAAVAVTPGVASGVAFIVVDDQGENTIVVASGANHAVTPEDVSAHVDLFADADVVVLQCELPMETVEAAIQTAQAQGCAVVLDPAPAPERAPAAMFAVDVITPNQSEAAILTGENAGDADEVSARNAAARLLSRGAKAVVLKLGGQGSLVSTDPGNGVIVPPFQVDVVDTTAAGDAFTGALAVALARGDRLEEAARFANAAGALACTRLGAQSAMPTSDTVENLLRKPGDG